ncbi:MAG: lysophospholipid acyltransferase family protein [Egibacteraceae bacterium]
MSVHDGDEGRERAPLLYRMLHAVVPAVLNAMYRPEVEGLEHVPERGPAILASNHLSTLDVLIMPSVLERPVYFLAKSEYFRGPAKPLFENLGVIPVERTGGDAAEASLAKGREILGQGHLLGIYPEGTRSPDGRLYRGKTGPVRLALRTGVPVVPVAMRGTFETMPPGARLPRLTQVGVRFGEPLDLTRYAGRGDDRFVVRSATDELMYELMLLSGQAYVDEYAAAVKAAGRQPGALDELGQVLDDDPFEIPRAS